MEWASIKQNIHVFYSTDKSKEKGIAQIVDESMKNVSI